MCRAMIDLPGPVVALLGVVLVVAVVAAIVVALLPGKANGASGHPATPSGGADGPGEDGPR
jgi:hypothetical protein